MGVAAIERTAAFRVLADSLQTTRDSDGSAQQQQQQKKRKPRDTRSAHGSSAFSAEAAELMKSLVAMEMLLRDVRPKYLRPKRFLRVKGPKMTEREKDEFDADFTELVKSCSSKIDALNDDVTLQTRRKASAALVEHEKEVVTSLLERLKSIANATKRMQKQRYDQPFLLSARLLPEDVRAELSALEDALPKTPLAPVQTKHKPTAAETAAREASSLPPPVAAAAAAPATAAHETAKPTPLPLPKPKPVMQRSRVPQDDGDEAELSEEQDRRLRAENVTLHRHFLENLEDAKSMESKMAEISHLMGQFADKIADQHREIELIHEHAKEAKDNVSQSNRILEQTQRMGRGYGFMIFCFYAAFSLLLHALHYFHN